MRIKRGTVLFSLSFNGICRRVKVLHANHPEWRFSIRRTGFGLWEAKIK